MKLVAFVPSSDVDASLAFYGGVLGLEATERNDFAVVVRSGDTVVRITKSPPFTPHPFTVLGWEVDDVAATVTCLTALGVRFARYDGMDQDDLGIWTAPGGSLIAWCTDPDGNLLSFEQHPSS